MSDRSNTKKVKEQILKLVLSSKAGVAYSKLMSIEDFNGPCLLSHPKFPMVHYWEGLSETAARAILELQKEGIVCHEPTDTLAYVANGSTLDLPIFTVDHVGKAAELGAPHWMPVLLIKTDH